MEIVKKYKVTLIYRRIDKEKKNEKEIESMTRY